MEMKIISENIVPLFTMTVFYLLYLFALFLAGGFNNIAILNWSIFSKLLIVIFPIYFTILILNKYRLTASDAILIAIPILFWLLLTLIFHQGGKSITNSLVIEPEMVIIITGLYLLKFVNIKFIKMFSDSMISYGLFIIILIGVFLVVRFVPTIGS